MSCPPLPLDNILHLSKNIEHPQFRYEIHSRLPAGLSCPSLFFGVLHSRVEFILIFLHESRH